VKTYQDLKNKIKEIVAVNIKGFDSNWVLRDFARKQALINITLIRPYTDKYELIVRFLVTGEESIRKEVIRAAAVTYDTAYTAEAAYIATYADAAYAASAYTNSAATAAADAAQADAASGYTKAIQMLDSMVNEYLGLLPQEPLVAMGYREKVN